jgi:hypothetical protein
MSIDLTAPAADVGVQLIIEQTTEPAVRHRVATDPTVVAIVERAAALTTSQRRRIRDAHQANFAIHRVTQTRLRHRVRHDGGPDHLTTRALNERIHDLLDCPGGGDCEPYHTCGTGSLSTAVQDAVFAHLAQQYLTSDEVRLLTAPWVDVAGIARGGAA